MSNVDTIPVGAHLGALAYTAWIQEQTPQVHREVLHRWVLESNFPNVRMLWLQHADWGSHELDDALAYLDSAEETSGLTVWCRRPCTASLWPSVDHWVVMDCTPLIHGASSLKEVLTGIAGLPFVPQPKELLMQARDLALVSPAVLDEIAGRLDPQHTSWLHVHSSDRARAVELVSRCSTDWGVR